MAYCSLLHENMHRRTHEVACERIRQAKHTIGVKTKRLQTRALNLFDAMRGSFFGSARTRSYLRTCFRLAMAYADLAPSCRAILEEQYLQLNSMLHMSRADEMGIRAVVPGVLIRLGRDQEAYDFVNWWATTSKRSNYNWQDTALPYLNLRRKDAFEECDNVCKILETGIPVLSHVVAIALIKLRLLLDIRALDRVARHPIFNRLPAELQDLVRSHIPISDVLANDSQSQRSLGQDSVLCDERMRALEDQVDRHCEVVATANKYFWHLLLDPNNDPDDRVEEFQPGSFEETKLTVQWMYAAWAETPGAIDFIRGRLATTGTDGEVGHAVGWPFPQGFTHQLCRKNMSCDDPYTRTRSSLCVILSPWGC